MTSTVVMIGIMTGVGAAVLMAAVWPGRRTLLEDLDERHRPASSRRHRGPTVSMWARIGRLPGRLLHQGLALVDRPAPRLRQDLAITGRTVETYLAEQATLFLIVLVLPALMMALGTWTGRAPFPPLTHLLVPAAAAAGCVFLVDRRVRAEAHRQRRRMRHTVRIICTRVDIALAGGSGVMEAFTRVLGEAHGWAADQLRDAFAQTHVTTIPVWTPLRALADRYRVPELGRLADTIELSERQGTALTMSLGALAEGLSAHDVSAAESAANAASEGYAIPSALIVLAVVLFLLYATGYQLLPVIAGFTG